MVKPEKLTAVGHLVYGIWQLIQEAAAEMTKCTELIPGDPAYMEFINESGEGSGGVWMVVT